MRYAPVAATVLVALAGSSSAEPTTGSVNSLEQARTFYNAGRDAFYAARYVVAIDAFERAIAMAPDRASVQVALGKAYRFQYVIDGDAAKAARAVELLRAYVAQVAEGTDRSDAVAMIGELGAVADRYTHDRQAASQPPVEPVKPKTALMVVSLAPGARATVDHGTAMPVPAIAEVAVGKHKVHVEAPGFEPADVDGVAADGQVVPVQVVLKELPGRIAVAAPHGATIAVDGNPVGTAPVTPISIAAGHHFVEVSERGHHAFAREVVATRGDTVSIDSPPLERTGQRTASYFVAGGALASVAGGVAASLFASSARDRANAIYARRMSGTLTDAEVAAQNQDVDSFNRDQAISYVLYTGAVALAATAVWLYVFDHPHAQSTTVIAPAPMPGGAAISLSGRLP
jgi:hypothetical protein